MIPFTLARHLLTPLRWRYFARGFVRRFHQKRACPGCGASTGDRVDRKYVYDLVCCDECRLLYRFPTETREEMQEFYQLDYKQGGLTTDLPGDAEISRYVTQGFAGTSKDFERVVGILRALGVASGARVLDYGANWGYGVWQLAQAGFRAEGYEISAPRARFARRLGVHVHTRLEAAGGEFPAVYSGHVLEHVSNPLETLKQQLRLVEPGGWVIAHTPNGSAERRGRNFGAFHSHWGQVHPVLLSAEFVETNFRKYAHFVSTETDLEAIGRWDQRTNARGPLDGSELLLILRKN